MIAEYEIKSRITPRPVFCVIDSLGRTSSARLIPSGVSSKAQAKTSAIGKPKRTTRITTFNTHGGASNVGKRIDDAWINNHATIAYATATL